MTCSVPKCGRRPYARGLCQTHHRQWLKTGTTTAIRPYRERKPGTIKYGGLRLSAGCVAALDSLCRKHDYAPSAGIAAVLEQWAARRKS